MNGKGGRALAALGAAATLALGAAAASVAADGGGTTATPTAAPHGTLHVGVEVLSFAASGRRATANGYVLATLNDGTGHTTSQRLPVALTARVGSSCRILNLDLKQLDLHLLGLNAHLGRVILTVTGDRHGGVLGTLFCRLARGVAARNTAGSAATVRAINARLARHHMRALAFTARVTGQTAQATSGNPTCPVLNLVLGPLHLGLLGLIVDLSQVNLDVTATHGAGALGDLFCQLADNSTTSTSTTTTPTTTTGTTAATATPPPSG